MRAPAFVCQRVWLPLLLLPAVATAGQPTLAREQWQAWWRGQHKVSWEQVRIEEQPDAGPEQARFVVREHGWRPTSEGRMEWEEETRVAADGRVLGYSSRLNTPWGPTRVAAERAGEALTWTVSVRELPPNQGRIEEPVMSPEVIELLVRRGEQEPGARQLRVLDLPGGGSEEERLEVVRAGDGWQVTRGRDGRHVRVLTADGGLIHGEDKDLPGERLLPASAADAADTSLPAPAGALEAVARVELPGGFALTRPGPDWRILRNEQPPMLMAEHPAGLALMALRLPTPMPADEAQRLKLGETLRQALNPGMKHGDEGLQLEPGTAATWRERAGVRFPVSGRVEGTLVMGQALLLPGGRGSVLVIEALAVDQAAQRAAALEAAREALILPGAGEDWTRVRAGALSLELPGNWTRQGEQTAWHSPLGASQLRVRDERVPPNVELRQAQALWAESVQKNPNIEEMKIERQEDAQVGGRFAHVMVLVGRLKPLPDGISTRAVRMASLVFPREGGRYSELVVVGFELDWDPRGVDRVVGSVRWIEEH